uniref:Ubiquitin hydrolase n=1 Tax=Tanacetum cinerariifolium TaxID=118510 RepID=A0A6L2MLR6_TANCI|nr:ubiquitin hydrolase [Tanacetum cinerariifolium]
MHLVLVMRFTHNILVGNKMHKAFPLPAIKFLLLEEHPTASEDGSYCQKKRDATARKIALLSMKRRNCQSTMPVTLRKFEQWQFWMQQYLQHEHYALWEVIEFRDSYKVPANDPSTTTTNTMSGEAGTKSGRMVTLTTEDMQKKKNDVKARTTLLLSLPDEHQLRFKVQKKTEPNTQIVAFISSAKHSRRNDEVNTASIYTASSNVPTASANVASISISQETACAYIASQSNGSQLKFEDINQIDKDDMEEMDIKWNMALLSMRADKAPINQDRGRRDNYRQGSKGEEQAPKALMAIDGNVASPITPKPFVKFVKASNSQFKSKTDEKETPKKPPVEYAEQYKKPNKKPNVKGNQRNWNNLKSHQLGPDFVMKKKACFNCGDFNHLDYKCRKRVKRGTTRSQNNTYKSPSHRPVVHRPNKSPMRPLRPNMNCACSNRTSFNKSAHSYTNRPVQRKSAVKTQYRAPWMSTVNRNFPPVNRKFSTSSRCNTPKLGRRGILGLGHVTS